LRFLPNSARNAVKLPICLNRIARSLLIRTACSVSRVWDEDKKDHDDGESAERSARSSYSTGTAVIAGADRAVTGTSSNQANAHSNPSRTHPTEYA
jgi:hypothetical protein